MQLITWGVLFHGQLSVQRVQLSLQLTECFIYTVHEVGIWINHWLLSSLDFLLEEGGVFFSENSCTTENIF